MPNQTAAQESNSDVSFLDLPDDELGKYTPFGQSSDTPAVADEAAAAVGDAAAGGDESTAGTGQEAQAEGSQVEVKPAADAAATTKPEDEAATAGEGKGDETKPGEAKPAPAQGEKPAAEAAPKEEGEKKDPPAIDYEAEYKKLMAPFKANGKEVAVQSADEAISLMQMGANYNKKMAALKPNLALLKMLETNGLLSEEKLSFLIDLDKKDPGAISKLIKESGIDPMDLDADKASGYKPKARSVDTRELELDEVLDSIQETPSYNRTLDVVKKWDSASKQAAADNPQLIRVINGHMEAGIYDLISAEIDRERMFGRLQGISDIEAYRQVGDAIHARGGFAHLGRQKQDTSTAGTVVVPAPKKADEDAALKDKKRAAAPAKPAAPAAQPQDFNPLAMSDEEFAKASRRLL